MTHNKKRAGAINTDPQTSKAPDGDLLDTVPLNYTSSHALFDKPEHDIMTVSDFGMSWRHGAKPFPTYTLRYIESSGTWFVENNNNGAVTVLEGYTPTRQEARKLIVNWPSLLHEDGGLMKMMERIRTADGSIQSDSPETT